MVSRASIYIVKSKKGLEGVRVTVLSLSLSLSLSRLCSVCTMHACRATPRDLLLQAIFRRWVYFAACMHAISREEARGPSESKSLLLLLLRTPPLAC